MPDFETSYNGGGAFRTYRDIDNLLNAFTRARILVVGDFMLDRYIWGTTDRISPEAPVQVVLVERESATLGGAGNVAHNLAALNARVAVCGVIGEDEAGGRILSHLSELGIDTSGLLRDPSRMSIQKTRILAANQQMLRIDREATDAISEELAEKVYQAAAAAMGRCDGVILSDYNKGALPPPLVQRLITLARELDKPLIADPKGNDYRKYRNATIITPNLKETAAASNMVISNDEDLRRAVDVIRAQTGDSTLLVTQGKDGMTLFPLRKPPTRIPARSREVFDVSGAGDTVIATLGLALCSGLSPQAAAWTANVAAGVVVGKVGTSPIMAEELRQALWSETYPGFKKFRDPEDLFLVADSLRRGGKKIVLANGCFDLLHAGHIRFLEMARTCGDILIVALDSDESVTKIKGRGRPILSETERVKIISALDSVDYVTVFPVDGLIRLLQKLQPHVLVKGSNYTKEEVAGWDVVEANGGETRLIPIQGEMSVTSLIDRIRNHSETDGRKQKDR